MPIPISEYVALWQKQKSNFVIIVSNFCQYSPPSDSCRKTCLTRLSILSAFANYFHVAGVNVLNFVSL